MNTQQIDSKFEALLDYLKRSRGFDFTGYKRASLMRRVSKRMQVVGSEDFQSYIDYLEVHPDEFTLLFNTILINVTSFFRDLPAWEYLSTEIVPRLLEGKLTTEPIRIWCAGCASGEEAYTVSMMMAEALGESFFRERVKIYATDLDEEALLKARSASYTSKDVEGVPADLLKRYFDPNGNRFVFRGDLRREVIFGRHDLLHDAPISRIDLLVCRNILMYFNADIQARVLGRMHFSLRKGGFLFLGKAEMLLTDSNLYLPIDIKHRIFKKVAKDAMQDRMVVMAQAAGGGERVSPNSELTRLLENVYDEAPAAQVTFNSNNQLALTNKAARHMFNLTQRDIGSKFSNLDLAYRPVDLRSPYEQARTGRLPAILKEVEWTFPNNSTRYLDIQIAPLFEKNSILIGISITFHDVTTHKKLQQQVEHVNQGLETAMEELQSANEELETTNEELQSTNEELETTNEELQSTNEELETMNEELQSTNQELETVNEELHQRNQAFNLVNAYLESILSSMYGGVVVLNRDMRVQVWNHQSENLWGLRDDEVVNQLFFNLDIGLPVEQLTKLIRECLEGETHRGEITLEARNRRGNIFPCRVTCVPLVDLRKKTQGVIMIMEASDGSGRKRGDGSGKSTG